MDIRNAWEAVNMGWCMRQMSSNQITFCLFGSNIFGIIDDSGLVWKWWFLWWTDHHLIWCARTIFCVKFVWWKSKQNRWYVWESRHQGMSSALVALIHIEFSELWQRSWCDAYNFTLKSYTVTIQETTHDHSFITVAASLILYFPFCQSKTANFHNFNICEN